MILPAPQTSPLATIAWLATRLKSGALRLPCDPGYGRIKPDTRFAVEHVPVPELTEEQRERIIKTGKRVLEARALHPERSLAEHYNPLAMDPALLEAHKILDREVDKAFGAPKRLQNERQRQELLFANYARLVEES